MAAAAKSHSSHWATVALAAPLRTLVNWYRISQERAALRNLPAERLSDVGLTHREVEWEASRPFWQAQRDD